MEFREVELDIIITLTEDVPSVARMDVMKEIIIVIIHKSHRKIAILSEKKYSCKDYWHVLLFLEIKHTSGV